MLRYASSLASVYLLFVSASAIAQPVCGERYIISAGDTLSKLAFETFGDPSAWLPIYQFGLNRSLIGPDPGDLPVGVTIDMPPCDPQNQAMTSALAAIANNSRSLGGAAGQGAAATADLRANMAIPASFPDRRPVEFLTGGDFQPLLDQDQPNGGMLAELVKAAFNASGIQNPLRVDFVNDRASHMKVLLRNDRYEFGFPWTKPDCANLQAMPERQRLRCEYVYSDPLYVVAIDVYGPRNGAIPPNSFKDLENKRLCRPVDRSLDDLEREGLFQGRNVIVERPRRLTECFQMLEFGEVDYVTDIRFTSEIEIQKLKLTDYVVSYPALVSAVELHLVAHRDDAQSSVLWMREFNRGLAKIQASGEWDSIIRAGIMEFRRSLSQLPN